MGAALDGRISPDDGSTNARRPRRDATRNRERLLHAASAVFGTGGAGASLEAVAREAGVGIGTLYRHFPTREDLFEAVYRREVEQLVALADTLSGEACPVEALRRWLQANVAFIVVKRGMAAALALAVQKPPALVNFTAERLQRALSALLSRAVAAGSLRGDVAPEDVLRAVLGICYVSDQPGWQETAAKLVDVFVDGLARPG